MNVVKQKYKLKKYKVQISSMNSREVKLTSVKCLKIGFNLSSYT